MRRRVFVAGHGGLVGSALIRALDRTGSVDVVVAGREQLDLRDQIAVARWFEQERPTAVLMAAARVGGIGANAAKPWEFLLDNLQIQNAVLGAALATGVDRLVFFGSSCIYPRLAPQPIPESALLTGPLEPTNEAYAIAKIAGVKLVDAAVREWGRTWVSLMPTNLYGPNDNFDVGTSHALPGMIAKFHASAEAERAGRVVPPVLWGTGTAVREFLHVDDLADAALHMLAARETGLFNVGSGDEVTIRELAALIAGIVGYRGEVQWDTTKPDGTPRKLIDSSRIVATGWRARISLAAGIRQVYDWYRARLAVHELRVARA